LPFELPTDLHPTLAPVAWLVGRWAGAGVIGYPSLDSDLRFGQEVEFSHDGREFLGYTSRTWRLDGAGNQVEPLAGEAGYWRVGAGGSAAGDVEVLLAHPTGYVEIFVGRIDGARAELATDLVARTATAKEYTSAKRMYGLVEGDLMWVMEMSAVGHAMTPHASARLKRR
jgi:hypothetical protein